MAYAFRSGETVTENLSRCADEQLERAAQELSDGVRVDSVTAVHEARKALKMQRSLLRLARGALPRSVRRRRNGALRDAARRLSGARDADVLLEALSALADRYAGQVPETTFAALRERLEADRERTRSRLEASGVAAEVADELRALRAPAGESLRRSRSGWAALEPGLRTSYRRGRQAMRRAQDDASVENLHEWRKRVKDLWYHLRLLGPAAPVTLAGAIDEAHHLSDLLGDDHDLAVLRETAGAVASTLATDLGPVLALIDHRRAALQKEAWFVGGRLYAETPKAFTCRLRRYWKLWRAQERAAAQRPVEVAALTRDAPVA